jgi:hypothetical protein
MFSKFMICWNLMPLLISYQRFGGHCYAFFKIAYYLIDKIYRFVL